MTTVDDKEIHRAFRYKYKTTIEYYIDELGDRMAKPAGYDGGGYFEYVGDVCYVYSNEKVDLEVVEYDCRV